MPSHVPSRRMAALALAAILAPAAALAGSNWSSVGSSGAPDDNCAGAAVFDGNAVRLGGAAATTCTLRYQISDTWGGAGLVERRFLDTLLLDPGVVTQVRVRLMALNYGTRALTALLALDSNSFPLAAGFQNRIGSTCADLDFRANSYFIEVDLVRTIPSLLPAAGPSPGFGLVRLPSCP
ncbi:hypothetical protein INH39_15000 [Massilia violaceinigra]|uniref:Secreted protein n=1 Tax=Massilia violaceinigra TaxID=2045208 RepID=A0ABY4ADS3_9BURK|nr:hypothetical protein [Massilia violaceinigra]UOD32848.1 hypothetical protein INH39_15000 [Massilia violaceinigra]